MPNKYLIAYTRYKSFFSLELETCAYFMAANNMKEAIDHLKSIESVYQIIAISVLDDSIECGNMED